MRRLDPVSSHGPRAPRRRHGRGRRSSHVCQAARRVDRSLLSRWRWRSEPSVDSRCARSLRVSSELPGGPRRQPAVRDVQGVQGLVVRDDGLSHLDVLQGHGLLLRNGVTDTSRPTKVTRSSKRPTTTHSTPCRQGDAIALLDDLVFVKSLRRRHALGRSALVLVLPSPSVGCSHGPVALAHVVRSVVRTAARRV